MIQEEYLTINQSINGEIVTDIFKSLENCSEDGTVIVLDRHNLGDGRITRHLNYISNHFHMIRLNFSPQNTTFGELTFGDNIDCYCYKVSHAKTLKYKTPKQLCIFAGYLPPS